MSSPIQARWASLSEKLLAQKMALLPDPLPRLALQLLPACIDPPPQKIIRQKVEPLLSHFFLWTNELKAQKPALGALIDLVVWVHLTQTHPEQAFYTPKIRHLFSLVNFAFSQDFTTQVLSPCGLSAQHDVSKEEFACSPIEPSRLLSAFSEVWDKCIRPRADLRTDVKAAPFAAALFSPTA